MRVTASICRRSDRLRKILFVENIPATQQSFLMKKHEFHFLRMKLHWKIVWCNAGGEWKRPPNYTRAQREAFICPRDSLATRNISFQLPFLVRRAFPRTLPIKWKLALHFKRAFESVAQSQPSAFAALPHGKCLNNGDIETNLGHAKQISVKLIKEKVNYESVDSNRTRLKSLYPLENVLLPRSPSKWTRRVCLWQHQSA